MILKRLKKKIVEILTFLKSRNNPFGKTPLGTEQDYLDLFNVIKDKSYPLIDDIEKKNGYAIDKNWLDKLALQTQIVKKKSKLNYQHGRILYSYLRNYLKKKDNSETINIFETGTARGFSSVCMSKALIDSGFNGKIDTIDIIPHKKKFFWNSISDASGKKSRQELLSEWKKEIEYINFIEGLTSKILQVYPAKKINFAFLDAQHDMDSVIEEYSFLKSRQDKGDIIIFDDVSKDFHGIKQAVENIKIKKEYKIQLIEFADENRGYAVATKV